MSHEFKLDSPPFFPKHPNSNIDTIQVLTLELHTISYSIPCVW
jgi:hypothetical protein